MTATDTHRAIEAVFRIEQAKLIAGLARMLRDVGLAEELAQEALVVALEHWPRDGIPDRPGAWLMATAKRRGIDLLRRNKLAARKHEELGREAEDAAKLSLRIGNLADHLREADFWAAEAGHEVIDAPDVDRAMSAYERRHERVSIRAQEMIERNIMLIDTAGAKVGQINGLSVMSLGGYAFGKPTRISRPVVRRSHSQRNRNGWRTCRYTILAARITPTAASKPQKPATQRPAATATAEMSDSMTSSSVVSTNSRCARNTAIRKLS